MTTYRFIFKCRLCGEKTGSLSTNDADAARQSVLGLCGNPADPATGALIFRETATHHCPDGSFVLADFIGAKVERAIDA